MLVILLLNVLLLSSIAVDGKSDPKFRMEKINFVWEKASHHKDATVVAKLQKDLATFDHLYLSIKQDAEHHKKTKSLSEVDAKLETLLRRYDLEDVLHAFKMKYKHDGDKTLSEQGKSELTEDFADERVRELWTTAKDDSDITPHDLEEFHRELIRQDNRCHDYKELLQHHKQTSDNHIHPHDEHETVAAQVKELNREIEEAFERLRERLSHFRENPFKNQKVRQLWHKALQSTRRLMPTELDVIKAELRHLDRHWDKVEHYSEHLGEHEEHLKSMGHEGTDEDSQQLRNHYEKLQRKLKKLEAYLEEKIKPASHTEL